MKLSAITCAATVCWAAALGAQPAPMLSLTPAAILGDSLAGPRAIGRPTAVTVAHNGDVIVFGDASRQIHRYTAAGVLTEVVDVPAGCQKVVALGFLGDTLWAADGDHRQLLLYPPGQRAPIAIATSVRGPPWGWSVGPAAAPSMLIGGRAVLQGDARPASAISDARSPLIGVTRDGVAADTIIWLAARSSRLSVRVETAPAGTRTLPSGTVVQAGPTMSGLITSQPYLPTLTRIRVGVDGSVWLGREGLNEADQRWTVLDSAGAVVGDVLVPSQLNVVYADLTRLYAVTQGADDRTVLRRYDVGLPR